MNRLKLFLWVSFGDLTSPKRIKGVAAPVIEKFKEISSKPNKKKTKYFIFDDTGKLLTLIELEINLF